jgi:hypothetical protein
MAGSTIVSEDIATIPTRFGINLYLILVVAIAVTAVFYNHLEINLKRKFSKASNILAWIHLYV